MERDNSGEVQVTFAAGVKDDIAGLTAEPADRREAARVEVEAMKRRIAELLVECRSNAYVGELMGAGRHAELADLSPCPLRCPDKTRKAPFPAHLGQISVTSPSGSLAYVGPPGDDVIGLMGEIVDWLESGGLSAHRVVRAAMAHLHVVSVHPFRDGNGRISRIVQSLVLAREQILSPEFGSIEDYLAQNTPAYCEALAEVQGGRYQPDRDASAWVDFCIEAHLAEATRRLEQVERAGRRWGVLEAIAEERRWPERLVIALEHSLTGGVERGRYSEEAEIPFPTASSDLRRLSDAGLVRKQGGGRNTHYLASADLQQRVEAD